MKSISFCTRCLSMSTRPRISFNEKGICNACLWTEKKKTINWEKREDELIELLNKHRSSDGTFDCLVPVSGGKDGSYVAHNLKNKYNMNPLCITVTPPLPTQLGEENLRSFVKSGYSHISINPPYEAMRKLNKRGFIEMGFPYFGWLNAINSIPVRIANQFNIGITFYGEDGELEYGGTSETEKEPIFDTLYMKRIYLESGHEKVILNSDIPLQDSLFFRFLDQENLNKTSTKFTHWSYFENWDPYRNYLIAKEFCGLKEAQNSNQGTFTNFAQNDQHLYSLHTYLMYLKFGFGRANQDACIEIRRGAMDRDQAINLVRMYDGNFDHDSIEIYLDYYQMKKSEFYEVLDKWANTSLFEKKGDRWLATFEIN